MFHVSVAPLPGTRVTWAKLWAFAREALQRAGAATYGDWRERGSIVVHLRRRRGRDVAAQVGPIRDVRGTPEAQRRYARVELYFPKDFPVSLRQPL